MKNNSNITIPQDVQFILDTLHKSRHQSYIVGGCIRDCILGNIPVDWDIATDAVPDKVKQLFPRTFDTGIKHGTVTVIINGNSYEVTTYRIDGEYLDYRKPDSVSFTSSIEEDLSRRDFTINAMAYNPLHGIVDPFGGISDIAAGIIKTVGDPDKRFNEDALRMLRAIRFSAQLGFSIDENTLKSIGNNYELIKNISAERIRDELTKILLSGNPHRFSLLMDTKLIKYTLPEFEACFLTVQNNPYHAYDVAGHTLRSVENIEKDRILRWTMLFHDMGKPGTKTTDERGIDHFYNHQQLSVRLSRAAMLRLRFDKRSMDKILLLVRSHDMHIKAEHKSVRKAMCKVGEAVFEDLLKVMEADKKAQNPGLLKERTEKFRKLWEIYRDIKDKKQCTSLKSLAVSGDDLLALGIRPGKEIKELLDYLLGKVLEEPGVNNKEMLLDLLCHHHRA
ncbi:MAG TPA: CCA tRNA nucleotidyltransferase [Clostridia bacterium]|nr:CCA tRNA nucleotidyltransferase [Clostridia bacterium]